MTRFWFEFDLSNYSSPPIGVRIGCGITATSLTHAMQILKDKVFKERELPPLKKTISDIDVSTLDAGHVLPNMGSPAQIGVWFPVGS